MDTIVLKCGTDTTVHKCDVAWTSDAGTASAEATIKKEGTHSAKVECGGSGLQAHAVITSADLSAALAVELWIRVSEATAAGTLSLLLDDTAACTSPLEALSIPALLGATWTRIVLTLDDPTALTAIVAVGIRTNEASTINVYLDDVIAVNARSFETYGVSGFDDVDKLRLWPGVQHQCADGEMRTRATAFGRIIEFKTTPKASKADRVWLVTDFALAETRVMVYKNEDLEVSLPDPETPFQSEWEGGFVLTRAYQFTLLEQSVRSTAPLSWT